ncbi:hypothetical protein ACPYOC_06010 [Ornithinimicrobium sp. W1665]
MPSAVAPTPTLTRHRGETVVVVRGGSATEPVLLLVDPDGTSIHSLDESD